MVRAVLGLRLLVTTLRQLRKAALGLPEVSEEEVGGARRFLVSGEPFAVLDTSGSVELLCGRERAEKALGRFGSAERLEHGGETVGVHVPLSDVNGMELNQLVYQAWLHCAPERLTLALRSAEGGVAPSAPDALPRTLGRPATSALLTAGVTTLSEAASWSAQRLLALHGFGPKALKLLQAALAERGMELERE